MVYSSECSTDALADGEFCSMLFFRVGRVIIPRVHNSQGSVFIGENNTFDHSLANRMVGEPHKGLFKFILGSRSYHLRSDPPFSPSLSPSPTCPYKRLHLKFFHCTRWLIQLPPKGYGCCHWVSLFQLDPCGSFFLIFSALR